MRIAIFGGSFNPVHKEHIKIAEAAKASLSLDKLIVMPSCITPQKTGKLTASAEDRLNMCRLAFGGMPNVEVSDYEINRGGISYSYLTCREYRNRYPEAELYFILGADMLKSFPHWKNPEEILKYVTLAVCARENEKSLEEPERVLENEFGAKAVKFGFVGAKVSSTRIRTLAALREDVNEYECEKVANYIKSNSLYKLDGADRVRKMLTCERWNHTVRVAVCAAENCAKAGVTEVSAVTAALFHDCAKYLNSDSAELAGFVCPEDVPPPVVHQYSGAYVAEKVFGIEDVQILDAIKYHTSGRENMGSLEKLIYLADMLEEGRSFRGVEELRQAFSDGLDEGMSAALEHQVEYLKSTGNKIYPLTMRAYEYIKGNKQ